MDSMEVGEVHGSNLNLLLLGIYMICIGEGAVRACLPALGGDQFDKSESKWTTESDHKRRSSGSAQKD